MHLRNVKVSEFSLFPVLPVFNFTSNSRSAPHLRDSIRISSPINKLRCLTLSTSSAAPVSSSDSMKEQSFVVSYLINSCGLSPKLALSKARFLKITAPWKPDIVLAFLKKHGFTKTQISNMMGRRPQLLHFNPENSFLPKLKFLSNLGLSREEITIIIDRYPWTLERSLEKVIIPTVSVLRNLLESDDKTVDVIRRYPHILTSNPDEENIETLKKAGMPPMNIVRLVKSPFKGPRPTPGDCEKIVEIVKEMGFDPSSGKFVVAMTAIMSMRKSSWDRKVQIFKKYGWSDHEILVAFEKYPDSFMLSEDRIMAVMDFLVNQMGVDAASLSKCPRVFTMNLEKKIVPRCLIYQALLEKELSSRGRKLNISSLLSLSKKNFLIRVIKPYEDEAPELVLLYQKMLDGEHD